MRVEWSPTALAEANRAVDYIAQDRPQAALDWLSALLDRVLQLTEFPDSGPNLTEHGRPDLRVLLHPPYRLIYRVDPDRVVILLVRHGRQELTETTVAEL